MTKSTPQRVAKSDSSGSRPALNFLHLYTTDAENYNIMSTTWRGVFTYNKYAQITARAVRQSMKETERVGAEKRGVTALRYQKWEDGLGGQQVFLNPEQDKTPGKAAV
ncbi:mitochondrial ATP synthase epsilon chain-domain-containing protein [Butyriboletus roseoflavus]|nr:mitochondrial ATP synthase epsilon chain-domain-containing protein [Butyriboletus roseoflavus]